MNMARMEVHELEVREMDNGWPTDWFTHAAVNGDVAREELNLCFGSAHAHYARVFLSNDVSLRLTVEGGKILDADSAHRPRESETILVRSTKPERTRLTFARRDDAGGWHLADRKLTVGNSVLPWVVSDHTGALARPSAGALDGQDHVPVIVRIEIEDNCLPSDE